MWRKQEEPKVSSPSQDAKVPARVEPTPVAAAPVASAPSVSVPPIPARVAAPPTSHLTSALTIKGEVTGSEDLYVDGEVQGKIRLDGGRVTVGPSGRIVADVDAREIVVRGKVEGNLNGRERVQIGPTGQSTGNIVTHRISIEEGAEVHGLVDITRAVEEIRPVRAAALPAAAGPEPARSLVTEAKEVPASA